MALPPILDLHLSVECSLYDGEKAMPPKLVLRKNLFIAPAHRMSTNQGGGVPSRMYRKTVNPRIPRDRAPELARHDQPVMSVYGVVKNLNLENEQDWMRFISDVIHDNEVDFRQALFSRALAEKLDGVVSMALAQRASSYREWLDESGLSKALFERGPKGGKYHARIPHAGGFKYYYDQEKYEREHKHVMGAEVNKDRCRKDCDALMEAASEGVTIGALQKIAGTHGAKVLTEVLTDAVKDKSYEYRDNRFHPKKKKKKKKASK